MRPHHPNSISQNTIHIKQTRPSPAGLGWKDVTVSKPYPQEFRDDVVRVARNRDPEVPLEQIASDFGIHYTTLYGWLKKADVDDGKRAGTTTSESAELREARKRIRLLEHENEVLRRAAAYLSQAHLPGK
ncbi:transposase-like protein IS3/IS911 [Mycobacterium shottsii]|uniref:Transposase-like protein IS3/IS911 n=1 Tax=Mycobacterium shottsii TaxID=133549 RepID=A0A7I7LBG5_9MYCO|nr:transposase-like protein IS3/IS911 [Mycobacterium shottsii]